MTLASPKTHRRRAVIGRLAGPMLLAFAAACAGPAPARPWSAQLETGLTWLSRNDVAVPGDTGTRFALDSVAGTGPEVSGRVYVGWQPDARNELRALAAPLTFSDTDVLAASTDFAGQTFAAGVPTDATYRFDSYRLTWRYLLHEDETFAWRAGLTGKIRDAEIELRQGPTVARKTDLGFVPLLHFAGEWKFAEDWRLVLDADAAWATQGRAIDATLQVRHALGERTELGLGYRMIEGGADNDEVYTFAFVHQAVLSFGVRF
jgi:hypothetical protein